MNKRKMEPNAQQDILEPKTEYKNGGRVGRTERLLETETLTDEEEKKTLNLSCIPHTLKIGNPHNGALPLLL